LLKLYILLLYTCNENNAKTNQSGEKKNIVVSLAELSLTAILDRRDKSVSLFGCAHAQGLL
jgi:hypothetical protein